MTPEELNALEALAAAATPGPWEDGSAFCCPDMGWVDGPNRTVCPILEPVKRTHTLEANDAAFIARAREAVPALIAALREARRRLAKADELLHGYSGFIGPCAHGSDPWDRCDECGDKTAVEAASETVEAQRQEIQRLKADPLPAAAWVREVERAAFARGVAAMREAAASHFSVVAPYDYIAPRIRALPDPEDKS